MDGRGFLFEHVSIKFRRPADGLTRIIDDEIQPLEMLFQISTKPLHAWGMAHIESKDMQAMFPVLKVLLLRVSERGIHGESRCDDQCRASPQEFNACLVTDFDPSPRQECYAIFQVCGLGPFAEIKFGTCRA